MNRIKIFALRVIGRIAWSARIHPGAKVSSKAHIGPLCIIGFPAEKKGFEKAGRVIILPGAKLTGLVTVDSGTEQDTVIGESAYLMKHSHIGHDAIIGDNATISCGAKIGGHARIGAHANIGLNATVHQRCEVPDWAMIGMNSAVIKKSELKAGNTYAGLPVRYISRNRKAPHWV